MHTATLASPAIRPQSRGTVSIKLDDSYRDRLRNLATRQKRTPHFLMKEAVQGYIEQAEIQQRFIQSAESAMHELDQTGLHNTFEELTDWLATWGTPNTLSMPPCHR